jgi:hypothetical protein
MISDILSKYGSFTFSMYQMFEHLEIVSFEKVSSVDLGGQGSPGQVVQKDMENPCLQLLKHQSFHFALGFDLSSLWFLT